MKYYNQLVVPLTNADTRIMGVNPRRTAVWFQGAQNLYWVNFFGAGATRVGITIPNEGAGCPPIEVRCPEPNGFVSQECRGFLNVAGPNNITVIEEIDE